MELIIYSGFSKRQNSLAVPAAGTGSVYDIILKDDCSIINPVFLISGVDLSANYCKFNGRYYYITDIVLISADVCELHCQVDALASWRVQILNSNQFVTRSSFSYDPALADGRYAFKQGPVIDAHNYVQGTGTTLPTALTEGYYVCACQGIDAGQANQSSYLVFNKTNLQIFLSELVEACAAKAYNWTDFVKKVTYYPEAPASMSLFTQVKIGKGVTFNPITVNGGVITGLGVYTYADTTLALPAHPQAATRGKWLNGSTATHARLIYGPVGEIDLPIDLLVDAASLKVDMVVDYIAGGARFRIKVNDQIVRSIDISGYGVDTMVANQQTNPIAGALQLAGGVAAAAASNYLGAASSVLSAITTYRGVPESVGSNGSRAKFMSSLTLIYEYSILTDEDNEDQGRPLCRNVNLLQMTGYIECTDVHLNFAATPAEKQEITAALESGVFIE